jgi:putative exosortase-associated protein (TIGR04073 family)
MAVEELDSSGPLTKLGRGIANVAFSPLELLKQPYDVNQNMGSIPALTYGVLRGVCFTVARIGVGVADIITFPMPLPGCTDDPEDYGWGYGPMMRPAWVMDLEHNPWGFFYEKSVVAE